MKRSSAFRRKSYLTVALSGLVAVSVIGTSAHAAELEEIIVTARKTEESLFETPVSVSVLSDEFFEVSGFNEIEEVVRFIPGFDYSPTNTTRANGTKIRGISTFSFSDGFESSVATVIDGVVMGREAQGFFDLYDIEALEVIKGPQGTLFGKNASAGVVNVRTKRPEFETSGGGDISFGTFNEIKVRGSVTGPLSDNLAYRITASSNTHDGKVDNALPGNDDVNDKDQKAVRAKLLYRPSDTFEALLTIDAVTEDNACCIATYRTAGAPTDGLSFLLDFALNNVNGNVVQLQDGLAAAGITPGPGNRTVAIFDDRINQESDAAGISLELNWDTNWGEFTSITAYRDWEIDEFNEADQLSFSDVNNRNGTVSDSEQWSQEIRLNGSISDTTTFVAGLYYFDQHIYADGTVFVELALPFPPFFNVATNAVRAVDTRSVALFGEFTFDLSDEFSLIVGGRYTDEELDAEYSRVARPLIPAFPFQSNFGPDFSGAQTVSDTNFSGRAILRYTPNDNNMIYLSYSEGYKGPGIDVAESANPLAVAEPGGLPVLDPEIPELLELGFKTRLLDNRLALNLTLFDQTVNDLQTISTDANAVTRNLSIDEVVSQGIEADFIWSATDALTLTASATYLDVEVEKFTDNPALEGAPYRDVPETAYSFTGNYVFDVGSAGYTGFVQAEYFWQDDKNTTFGAPTPANTVDSYGVANLRLGINSPSDKYFVNVAVENLFDEDYPSFVFGTSYAVLDGVTRAQYLYDPINYSIMFGARF